jgi:hypothetical protein
VQIEESEPLGVVLGAVYDIIIKLSEGVERPPKFQHDFLGHVTRVEMAMLREQGDLSIVSYPHPLPAMRKYRSFMCGAHVYDQMGNAKIRIRDFDVMEIRYWHCPYRVLCASRDTKVCLRTHSMAEAAELMSPVEFEAIESLEFSEEGNCLAFLEVRYTGDLREIDVEDKVVDEKPCIHFTHAEAETFLMRTFLVGAEYACKEMPGIRFKSTLREMAKRMAAAEDEDTATKHPFLRIALGKWKDGESAFIRAD